MAQIKNWPTSEVILEYEGDLATALVEAVQAGKVLTRANLYGANLYRANLDGANLDGANLDGANLYGANLYGANLYCANLYRANLDGANLDGANLYGANLYGANLYGANLYRANLDGANLDGANLYGANLYGANLYGANLYGANLYCANLDGANLDGDTKLDTGETWEQYLTEVLPALLTAGGKALSAVATPEHWSCHEWSNCPMAAAFDVTDESGTPVLLRPRVRQFVQLFDAKLIPLEKVNPSAVKVEPATEQ